MDVDTLTPAVVRGIACALSDEDDSKLLVQLTLNNIDVAKKWLFRMKGECSEAVLEALLALESGGALPLKFARDTLLLRLQRELDRTAPSPQKEIVVALVVLAKHRHMTGMRIAPPITLLQSVLGDQASFMLTDVSMLSLGIGWQAEAAAQAPAEQPPAEQAPEEQAPAEQAPAEQAPAEHAPAEHAPPFVPVSLPEPVEHAQDEDEDEDEDKYGRSWPKRKRRKLTCEARDGDTLWRIARRHRIEESELRILNPYYASFPKGSTLKRGAFVRLA